MNWGSSHCEGYFSHQKDGFNDVNFQEEFRRRLTALNQGPLYRPTHLETYSLALLHCHKQHAEAKCREVGEAASRGLADIPCPIGRIESGRTAARIQPPAPTTRLHRPRSKTLPPLHSPRGLHCHRVCDNASFGDTSAEQASSNQPRSRPVPTAFPVQHLQAFLHQSGPSHATCEGT
jgi:hypothetical protein